MTGPTDIELRVLGCLLEKQRTTPDAYPLTLNALRLACNQSTNRDPVVDYDEPAIRVALQSLARRRWVRFAGGAGSRAPKYRQLFDEALELSPPQTALLCTLLLRGAQTPGELKQRSERLHPFAGIDQVHGTLGQLAERGLAARLERRPGQKEERFEQRIGGDSGIPAQGAEPAATPAGALTGDDAPAPPVPDAAPAPAAEDLEPRIARLEADVARMSRELAELRESLGG